MSRILTARAVEAAKPKNGRRNEIPDGTGLGLYLAVEPTGTKIWVLRCRHAGVSKRITLGRAGEGGLTLVAARAAAAAARQRVEQAKPVAPPGATPRHAAGDRIEAAVASFLELHARRKTRPSTAWATERVFNRLVLPAWRGRSVHDITRRDVIALVEDIATDRPYLANRTLGTLSKFYNWLRSRDVIESNPAAGVEKPHREEPRTRTLTDPEIAKLWHASESDQPFGDALRLLLLTGARRDEVTRMRWSEIDEKRRLWSLSGDRTKNARTHTVPLSDQAWRILEARPQINGSDFVFTIDGRQPIRGWAKAKTRLSERAGLDEGSWRLHDLRRTCASGMQRLGIAVPVVEKALNHMSGTFRGIVGVYQTHDYAAEKRDALQRWANHVEGVVSGKIEDKVVPIAARR